MRKPVCANDIFIKFFPVIYFLMNISVNIGYEIVG